MCGIVGVSGSVDGRVVRAMLTRLAHRGPDAEGVLAGPVTLGHRRLAIMDPDGGDQPIRSRGGETGIVANGEIYNSPSLRSRLEAGFPFRTRSDSEAALALFTERGPAGTRDLEGMFAFAIADGEDLFVARDPVGIKPLYRARRDGQILFASEIKALVGLAEEVTEFPPGTWFHSREGTRSYYEVPDGEPVPRTVEAHVARVRETLERSVVKRLMSDVPLGAFLSGGLDSSLIAALVRPHVDELHTFSVGLEGSPDLEAARVVARHLDTVHHEHRLRAEEVAEVLPAIVFHLESFDRDLVRSAIPTWFTARLAADSVKVILTGEGADELFAGYGYYRRFQDPAELHTELRRSVRSLHNVNLQRVDRMTMAHSVEGRVPFLDLEMIDLAQTIPPQLKLKGNGKGRSIEKWVLRKAAEEVLPPVIVWRDKEQFDEGSGTVNLLSGLVDRVMSPRDARRYAQEHAGDRLRSPEECLYHRLLCETFPDPTPVLANVARWAGATEA
jgi:asparagine synthase (glutamine-hydrolysing)